jgi:hypothetical protein
MPEVVNCPHCGKKLRVPDTLLGKRVKCVSCGEAFVAEADGVEEPEGGPPPGSKAGRRPPAEDEERVQDRPRRGRARAEEDEEEERPRRGRRRDEEDEEEEDDRPRRKRRRGAASGAFVKAPAIALLVVGILGVLVGFLYVVQAIVGRPLVGPGGPVNPDAAATQQSFAWVFAFLSLIWGAVVTLGGVKLLQLQSWGSVLVAAIFAMLPCNPCCLLGLPVGIWTLVVLNNSDVKRSFG